jgi:L-asparaginase
MGVKRSSPPRIALITTGGTIGERVAVEGASRHLPARALLGGIPDAHGRFELSTTDLFDIPSTFMTFDRMLELARTVDAAGRGEAVGVVVTHGTDTLEETAYFVDLVSAPGVPVVFTGAMRPPELPSADGPLNLWHACLVASAPHARRRGVLIAMAGEIHAAREVMKAHSQSATAFRSLEFGPVGTLEEDRVVFHRSLPTPPTVPVRAITARVEALKCYADMSDIPLRAVIEAGFHGVVLEALGSGQVPPRLMAAIRKAIAAGVTVVATTRCTAGRLIREHYGLPIGVEGDERDLLDAGVIFSDLQGPKARIALVVGLSAGLGRAELQRILEMGERA